MSLRTLKALARQSATLHGHTLTRFYASDTRYHFAQCSQCNQGVRVTLTPRANEAQIAGEAVVLNCEAVALHCEGAA
jgi:hypothetical protein